MEPGLLIVNFGHRNALTGKGVTVDYTPLSYMSDEEFVAHLTSKRNPTTEEVEAMVRLDKLLEHLEPVGSTKQKHKEVA